MAENNPSCALVQKNRIFLHFINHLTIKDLDFEEHRIGSKIIHFEVKKVRFRCIFHARRAWRICKHRQLRWQHQRAALANAPCHVGKRPMSRSISRPVFIKTAPIRIYGSNAKKKANQTNCLHSAT